MSQSTIKMDKGYYKEYLSDDTIVFKKSQSTIKMDKGYYKKQKHRKVAPWKSRNPQ